MENKYSCPMHPEVTSDKPDKCSKCGMDLVEMLKSGEKIMGGDHSMGSKHDHIVHHDHTSMMSSPQAARDFLKRFYIVTVLLIPLLFFSEPAVKFLNTPEFAARRFIEFGIATVIFYFGFIFFKHANMEIAMKQYGMMTLVSLGIGSGYLFSAASTFLPNLNVEFYLEIATLIWVLLFGHFLEAKSSSAAGDALSEVAKLLPKKALRLRLGPAHGFEPVEIDTLKVSDVVLVKAGEKVPADGVIVRGSANFNESHISGESKPVNKKLNDEVVAGAINIDGSIEVKLTKVGESSTIGQIKNLIATAKNTKPSAQKLADRASRWLTFSALGVSFITLFVWSVIVGQPFVFAVTLAITVLVIACPHALGLAIPTVSTIATRLAAKNGFFIKDMAKIEVVKGTTYLVFDKTGTLTKGNFAVTKVESENQKELLTIAASIEKHSSHVIGASIVDFVKAKKIKTKKVTSIKNLEGKGIEGKIGSDFCLVGSEKLMKERKVKGYKSESSIVGTKVYVAKGNKFLGYLVLSDEIKKESKPAISALHDLGVKVAMLTGDTKNVAEPIAKKLGIDTVYAEVLPEDKYKYVKKLQDKGEVVVMAGDGVNDAPALTQANVGVAIGAGTDVAVEAGDIVLTQSNPSDIVKLIKLSREVYRKMLQNLYWALGYNVIAIPSAAGLFIPLGFRLTPAIGAFVMSLSSVIVVVNAMSLRRVKLEV